MRILHIFDCAAVACTLAKFQNKMGHDAHVISFKKMDPFGFLKFYGFECLNTVDPTEFYLNAIDRAVDYDIIHVHFVWGIIPYLRNKYGHSKKIILHYHGSDIRQFQNDTNRIKAEREADYVLGSTKELCDYSHRVCHVPNPIDTDHFSYETKQFSKPTYFTILSDEEALVRKHINDLGIDCDFIVRKKASLSYADMPKLFSNYTHYVDIKYQDGKLLPDRSKSALEALACGLHVITENNTQITRLPKEHTPEHVTESILNIYQT